MRTVATYGADTERIARLGRDAGAAAAAVLVTAKANGSRWGEEGHYAIAERCVLVTYRVLIDQLKADAPVLLATIQALREELAVVAERGHAQGQRTLDGLTERADALVAVGTLDEVVSYLQARIEDWDAPVWAQQQRPASA